jgi:hypothetical protein
MFYLYTDDVEFTSEFGMDEVDGMGGFAFEFLGAEVSTEKALFGDSALSINLAGDSARLIFPARDEVWIRSFLYFSDSVLQESLSMQLFKLYNFDTPDRYIAWFLDADNAGVYNLELHYYQSGNIVQKKNFNLGKDFLLASDFEQWHEIVLRVKLGTNSSSVQLWRNGEIYTHELGLNLNAFETLNEIEFVKADHLESDAKVFLDGVQVLEN